MSYLIEIEIDDKLLFLDNTLTWKFQGNNGLYEIEKQDYSLYILPLLEYDLEDIKSKIPNEYFNTLPVIKLLKFPFENEMKYWAELSLKWIEKGGYKAELFNWAKDVDIHWMPQKLKHSFWKTFGIRSYQYIPPPDGVKM